MLLATYIPLQLKYHVSFELLQLFIPQGNHEYKGKANFSIGDKSLGWPAGVLLSAVRVHLPAHRIGPSVAFIFYRNFSRKREHQIAIYSWKSSCEYTSKYCILFYY